MKKLVIPLLVAALALSGCTTTGFLGFLATTGYVDTKTKKLQADQEAEIAKLKAQAAEMENLKDQIQASLASMPKEVLKELSDAINAYFKTQ